MATDEDKEWRIDEWAKLFAAKTWSELKMIAKNNEILTSATESLYMMNSDELIREQCRAREDFERHERTVQRDLAEQADTIKKQADTINEQADTINEQADTINEQADTINEQADTINEQADTINEQADTISALNARIKELEAKLASSK